MKEYSIYCNNCHYEFSSFSLLRRCPKCKGDNTISLDNNIKLEEFGLEDTNYKDCKYYQRYEVAHKKMACEKCNQINSEYCMRRFSPCVHNKEVWDNPYCTRFDEEIYPEDVCIECEDYREKEIN